MCTQAHLSHAFETYFMCDIMFAKKKANFGLWLCFERRKIFRETVLQILLICICLFSCSSTVTPRRRCFETCFIGVVSKFRFKERERDRDTNRQTQREIETETDRQTETETERQRETETDTETDRQTEGI